MWKHFGDFYLVPEGGSNAFALRGCADLVGPLHYRSTIEHGAIDADLVEAALNAVGTWR